MDTDPHDEEIKNLFKEQDRLLKIFTVLVVFKLIIEILIEIGKW
jgi:hypothetical protein